jgi:hypothetical protein
MGRAHRTVAEEMEIDYTFDSLEEKRKNAIC